MTTGAAIFVGAWLAFLAWNLVGLVRSVLKLRRDNRDHNERVSASVDSFELSDGWIRAHVFFSNGKHETWVLDEGGGQWRRLPDMLEAPESWGSWLTHELAIVNRKTAAYRFAEKNR